MRHWRDCSIGCCAVMSLMLSGCEIQPVIPAVASPEDTRTTPYRPTTVGGQILLAEGLLQDPDGDIPAAIALYQEAVTQSEDAVIAARATALARQYGSPEETDLALQRWLDRAPDNLQAHEASLVVAIESNHYDRAIDHLTFLLSASADYKIQWISGLISRSDDPSQSVWLSRLAALASSHANTSLAMVVTELTQNRGDDGTQWLDNWLDRHQAYDALILYRARLELPDRPAAISVLERLTPAQQSIDVRAQLARWVGLEGQDQRALSLLTEVVAEDPKRERDRLTLALLLMQTGDNVTAEGHLKALLASPDLRSTAYYHLGDLARLSGDQARAIDRFLRVDQGELVVDARQHLAQLAVATGNPDQAIRWFQEARLLFPYLAPPLYVAEARFLSGRENPDAVIVRLSEAIGQHPDNPDLRYSRALAYAELNQIEAAEADLRAILKIEPESVDALNALGYTLADQTDRYDEAFRLIEKALAGAPESPAILDSMGWVLVKLGRIADALPFFKKAWEAVQDHEIAAHYGEALWRLGRQSEAWEIWNQGFASQPESAIITATIERLTNP
jgi:tetratricopeptide (TPR) repeat protein